MLNTLIKLIDTDSIFWICALSGSGLFLFQFLIHLFAGDGESAHEGDFSWLSKQAVSGFLMMLGWVGLTCSKEFHLSGAPLAFVALLSGLGTFFITGFIFRAARKLRSKGTVFKIEDAIGKEAFVYQRIPKGGLGKVSLALNQFTQELDAISEEELPSFTSVLIIKNVDEKTVFVVPKSRYL